jgi:hypothetical protein
MPTDAAGVTVPEMRALIAAQAREIVRLRRQVAWFQRQIFGQKSERRMPEPEGAQGTPGEAFDVVPDDVAPAKPAASSTRFTQITGFQPTGGRDCRARMMLIRVRSAG